MNKIFIAITIIIACYLIHKFCLWLESKGWLYYLNKKSPNSALGAAMEELNGIINPSARYAIEMKQNESIVRSIEAENPDEPMTLNNKKLTISISTPKEKEYLEEKLIEYNSQYLDFTHKKIFTSIDYSAKDEKGNIIAGITSILYAWGCLYIDTLWVDENHRNRGIGSMLLNKVENHAKNLGCNVVNLNTFDFQAKEFYVKKGYEIFGVLEECAPGHSLFFLKKRLISP